MDSDLKSRRQVTYEQLKALLEFLKEHQELARGLVRGRRGKLHTLKLWNLCAKTLNVFKDGANKNGKGWSKYWCDWKYRVRRRALELKAAKDGNRAPPESVTPLSTMEEVILNIIGEHALEGVIIKSDPLAEGESEEDGLDNNDDAGENQYYATDSTSSRAKKRRRHSDASEIDEDDGVGGPPERKLRLGTKTRDKDNTDVDDEASEFLRLEREKLENSKKIYESVQMLASEVTRLADVMSHIRDVLINNRGQL